MSCLDQVRDSLGPLMVPLDNLQSDVVYLEIHASCKPRSSLEPQEHRMPMVQTGEIGKA